MGSMSQGWPYMCTTMIAFVRGVMAASIFAGSMHHVSGSTSTSTGLAPAMITTLAVTMMVKSGMITSSPAPTPIVSSAMWSPTVPLAQATPWVTLQYRAKLSSNWRTYFPCEEIQRVSRQSMTYFFSLPRRTGSQTGIISELLVPYFPAAYRTIVLGDAAGSTGGGQASWSREPLRRFSSRCPGAPQGSGRRTRGAGSGRAKRRRPRADRAPGDPGPPLRARSARQVGSASPSGVRGPSTRLVRSVSRVLDEPAGQSASATARLLFSVWSLPAAAAEHRLRAAPRAGTRLGRGTSRGLARAPHRLSPVRAYLSRCALAAPRAPLLALRPARRARGGVRMRHCADALRPRAALPSSRSPAGRRRHPAPALSLRAVAAARLPVRDVGRDRGRQRRAPARPLRHDLLSRSPRARAASDPGAQAPAPGAPAGRPPDLRLHPVGRDVTRHGRVAAGPPARAAVRPGPLRDRAGAEGDGRLARRAGRGEEARAGRYSPMTWMLISRFRGPWSPAKLPDRTRPRVPSPFVTGARV